jgi:mevalonate kinase
MRVSTSAPGKLMLFGEHAVVYDRPCIVSAADIRYRVRSEPRADQQMAVTSSVNGQTYTYTPDALRTMTDFPREAAFVLSAIKRLLKTADFPFGLNLTTAGPALSYGLGSSSAVTVATIGNLNQVYELGLVPAQIFRLAYDAVLDVQGAASGFDVAAAVYGGTLYFVTGGQTIVPLDVPELPIVIGYSGRKVGTVNLIDEVRQRRERHPRLIDGVFDHMADITRSARASLQHGDWASVGELADIHQGLLDSLGVNTLDLSRLIFAAREAGALGAKLSGAGGGDCMFAVCQPANQDMVQDALRAVAPSLVTVPLNAPGLRQDD